MFLRVGAEGLDAVVEARRDAQCGTLLSGRRSSQDLITLHVALDVIRFLIVLPHLLGIGPAPLGYGLGV